MNQIHIFLLALLVPCFTFAQTPLPARQVSVLTNGWDVLDPTGETAQAAFDSIDDLLGDGLSGITVPNAHFAATSAFAHAAATAAYATVAASASQVNATNVVVDAASWSNLPVTAVNAQLAFNEIEQALGRVTDLDAQDIRIGATNALGTNLNALLPSSTNSSIYSVLSTLARNFKAQKMVLGYTNDLQAIGTTNYGVWPSLKDQTLAPTSSLWQTFNWIDNWIQYGKINAATKATSIGGGRLSMYFSKSGLDPASPLTNPANNLASGDTSYRALKFFYSVEAEGDAFGEPNTNGLFTIAEGYDGWYLLSVSGSHYGGEKRLGIGLAGDVTEAPATATSVFLLDLPSENDYGASTFAFAASEVVRLGSPTSAVSYRPYVQMVETNWMEGTTNSINLLSIRCVPLSLF